MLKFNAAELRTTPHDPREASIIPRNPITIILDNVLDTYNVGAIFRLADAVAVTEVLLCGATLTPPNSRIKKASINTWQWVPWRYVKTTKDAVLEYKKNHSSGSVVAVEQDAGSKPYHEVAYTFPIALIVGNETYGISKDVLALVDSVVELPMWGVNKSLNVMASCGIVLYEIMKKAR